MDFIGIAQALLGDLAQQLGQAPAGQRMIATDGVFSMDGDIAPLADLADTLKAMQDKANQDHEGFWVDLAREEIDWKTPFSKGLDESNAPHYEWFADGTLNVFLG